MPQQFQQAEEAIGLSPDIDEPEERNRDVILLSQPLVASGELLVALASLSCVGQHVSFYAVAVRILSKYFPRAFRRRHHDYMADLLLSVQRRADTAEVFDFQGKPDLVVRVKAPDSELFDLAHDDIYSASSTVNLLRGSFEIRCPSRTASETVLSWP